MSDLKTGWREYFDQQGVKECIEFDLFHGDESLPPEEDEAYRIDAIQQLKACADRLDRIIAEHTALSERYIIIDWIKFIVEDMLGAGCAVYDCIRDWEISMDELEDDLNCEDYTLQLPRYFYRLWKNACDSNRSVEGTSFNEFLSALLAHSLSNYSSEDDVSDCFYHGPYGPQLK